MLAAIGALAWTAVLAAAFAGWGTWAQRALAPEARVSLPERAVWGMAACVVAGGAVDLAGVGRRSLLLAIVGAGALLSVPAIAAIRPPRWWRAAPVATLLLCAGLALFALGSVSTGVRPGVMTATTFNPHDDFHAYLVFPERLVQTGRIGDDPFSERRLSSALGGQSFLDGLMVAGVNRRHLHLLDPVLGLGLAVAVVLATLLRSGHPPRVALVAGLLLFVIPPPTVNVSALATGVAILAAMAATATIPVAELPPDRRAVAVGVLAAAGAALKSTLLVPALLMGALLLRTWRERLVGGAVILAGLTPWMLSLRRSSGTLLYPLLGRGTRGPVPDPSDHYHLLELARVAVGASLRSPAAIGLGVVVAATVWAWLTERKRLQVAHVLAAAALATWGALATLTAGADVVQRFAYPALITAAALSWPELWRAHRRAGMTAVLGVVLVACDSSWLTLTRYRDLLAHVRAGRVERDSARYAALQGAVPAGAAILTRLERPYLLDFRRNVVYVYDWPGGASPSPGMPTGAPPDSIAAYLRRVGVRYVAYEYATEAGFARASLADRLARGMHPWVRDQASYTFAFHDDVTALAARYPRIFDDGRAFVLDVGGGGAAAVISAP